MIQPQPPSKFFFVITNVVLFLLSLATILNNIVTLTLNFPNLLLLCYSITGLYIIKKPSLSISKWYKISSIILSGISTIIVIILLIYVLQEDRNDIDSAIIFVIVIPIFLLYELALCSQYMFINSYIHFLEQQKLLSQSALLPSQFYGQHPQGYFIQQTQPIVYYQEPQQGNYLPNGNNNNISYAPFADQKL